VKYGCPFPAVRARGCSATCCYNDPLFEIRSERRAGKRVLLWWWREPRAVRPVSYAKHEDLASDWPKRLFRRLGRRYAMARVELAHAAAGWECYELVEK
jgi:hypothetical protein